MKDTREGDQLELRLGEEFLVGAARLPWGGRSPRALTRGYERFILKAQAKKSVRDSVDPNQYDLWLSTKKAPWLYQGAPLLQDLHKGVC